VELEPVLNQVVRDSLWPAALGLGCVYLFTAISHALRLLPPQRLPLSVTAGACAAVYFVAAGWFRRRPPSVRLASPLAALLAVMALGNEGLQQATTPDAGLQVYTSLYLMGVGVFMLSPRWQAGCVALGFVTWAVQAWSEGPQGAIIEWGYAHGAATIMGTVAMVARRRTHRRIESLRLLESHRAAELHKVLQHLRDSESLFRQFADHSGQVFWINDGKTHQVSYINRVYESLVGRPIDRLRDDPLDWLGAVHPDDRPRVSRAYLDCLATGVFDERYRIVRGDGQVRWVHDHGFLIRDDAGAVRRVGGIMRDVTERVLAERQLRESEQTNRAILFAIPDMILRLRRDGSYKAVQLPKNFEAFWLQRGGETALREFIPQALYIVGERQVAAALETGQVQSHEYQWTGTTWREWRMAPVGDDEVLVIVRDITARKLAEQALEASRQRLSDLVADVDGIVWECSIPDYRFTYVSPRAQTILGYPIEDWLDQPDFFRNMLHPDDRDRAMRYCLQKTEQGLDHELQYRAIAADGRHVWVHDKVHLVKDQGGKVVALRGILVDITETMRSAQALRDSQAILDKAQEIALLGSWVWDAQRDRVTWSPQMYRIYGITPEQFDGSWMHAFEMIHPEDQQRVWQAAEQAIARGVVEMFEYRVVRPDGALRTVRADGELHYDKQRTITRIIGTVQDITELRRAEAERARLEDELRQVQKLEAVGTLASGVAHDFNNLLTAINGYADLARQVLEAGHPARKSLEMIELATDQAAGVTRGLLTFAHHTPFEKSPIQLAPNISQSLQLLRRLIPASIELAEDLDGDGDIWVNADAHQLQQVWLNLAVNARDAMPAGGRLLIRLRRFTDAPVNPQDSWHGQAGDTAVITVTDTGMGMGEQTMARVFEPYFTTKPRGQGTGLGLSIVHGIVSDHAGRIRVQSEPGKGTRFTIYLPCCPKPDLSRDKAIAPPGPMGKGQAILLAEDNEFVRAIMVSSLESAGYLVHAAADGEQATDAFIAHRASLRLVILDLDLPKRSGDECLRRIREAGDGVPVVIITGNAVEGLDESRHLRETVLMKPFQVARLIEVVNELMAHDE
jgi:PAS domain S-box-containing protein